MGNPALSTTPKTVLITGAARRIGRAIAESLAADGWTVAVHFHGSSQAADEVLASIASKGGRAVACDADLSDPQALEALIPHATRQIGPLGCLINNASIFERDDIETATLASWDSHMAINLRAPFFLTQAFTSQLPASMTGSVINIIDERVWHLTPHFASYTLSKAGLWAMTQTLAMALAPQVRVVGVAPGLTLTSHLLSDAQFEALHKLSPLGRSSTPADVAATVKFALENQSLTGTTLLVDGGQHLMKFARDFSLMKNHT